GGRQRREVGGEPERGGPSPAVLALRNPKDAVTRKLPQPVSAGSLEVFVQDGYPRKVRAEKIRWVVEAEFAADSPPVRVYLAPTDQYHTADIPVLRGTAPSAPFPPVG